MTTRDFNVASTDGLADLLQSVLTDPEMQVAFNMVLITRVRTGPVSFNQTEFLHEVCDAVLKARLATVSIVKVLPQEGR